ncbi:MAG: hypothetical protein IPH20_26210 [Bacteroidales bacterium]|nr:hypothetical protein [Bacteroidales bacterium]
MKILIIDDSVFFREKLKEAIFSMDISILILEELTYERGKLAFSNHTYEKQTWIIKILSFCINAVCPFYSGKLWAEQKE